MAGIVVGVDEIALRLDRTSAQDLHDLLYVYGQHLATGAPIVPLTNEESYRIGTILTDLGHQLGKPCGPNCQHLNNPPDQPA